MSGFGRDSDWLRNLEAGSPAEVDIGPHHFAAAYRFLDEEEATRVVKSYEKRNSLLTPIVHYVLSRLLGWPYRGSEADRRKLVAQLPLLAFRPRTVNSPNQQL